MPSCHDQTYIDEDGKVWSSVTVTLTHTCTNENVVFAGLSIMLPLKSYLNSFLSLGNKTQYTAPQTMNHNNPTLFSVQHMGYSWVQMPQAHFAALLKLTGQLWTFCFHKCWQEPRHFLVGCVWTHEPWGGWSAGLICPTDGAGSG